MQSSSLPTGTVTFWFSDIEGSTERWDRDAVAMQEALRRHDAIVRAAIESRGGYIFKTIGDAFCAAFSRAEDAATSALAAHRELSRADFSAVGGMRIRIAMHSGVADERDGDYFGPVVNRVARLLAASWGGQTVLSAATTELVRAALAPGVELRDLGDHRLKDLSEPERVSELIAPDLPSDFPPLRSLDASRNNLPTHLLPLLGREELVAEIEGALAGARLVTLAATGGIGKTRTALHVAADVLDRFSDGVWYVELASVSEESGVAVKVLTDIGLRESGNRTPLESVMLWLSSREALLVLDNCEHVVAEAARVSGAILARCPRVKILATSRESLGITGERVLQVPSLRIPRDGVALTAEAALAYGAIELFVERARAADASFVLTDANASVVSDICRRLDGIALAIELAASRIRLLSIPQLAAKLDERFRLLIGGRRAAVPRQATLHAMIAWSYELLDERERRVFEYLGTFMDAWTLEAAIDLCRDETGDEYETLDAIHALANKSLVAVEGDVDAKTYRLLESTRAFALLKLSERGMETHVRARHAARALRVAEDLDAASLEMPSVAWEVEANAVAADLRAALVWSLHEGNDEALGVALAANLRWFWSGLAASEGRREVRRALDVAERIGTSPAVRARLDIAAATIATVFGEFAEQLALAEHAIELLGRTGDRLDRAIALRMQSQALYHLGRVSEGRPLIETALAEFRALGVRRHIVLALDIVAAQRSAAGDAVGARADYVEAVRLATDSGFERMLLFLDVNLGEAEFALGNVAAAIPLAERAVRRSYAKREPATFAVGWSNLGMYYGLQERWMESADAAATALVFARESALRDYAAYAFQIAAAVAAAQGDAKTGALLLGFADRALGRFGATRGQTEGAHRAEAESLARTRLDQASFEGYLVAGASLTEDEAARLAWPPPLGSTA
jgi:predicted ATPase/class 3 adenylate cyclase